MRKVREHTIVRVLLALLFFASTTMAGPNSPGSLGTCPRAVPI
jgi:hypothetical protein